MSSLWNPWRKRWLTAELFGKLVYLLSSKRPKRLKERSNGKRWNVILLRSNFGRWAWGSIFTMYNRLTIYDARGVRVGAWTGVICSGLILQQPWDGHVFNISIYSQVDWIIRVEGWKWGWEIILGIKCNCCVHLIDKTHFTLIFIPLVWETFLACVTYGVCSVVYL